MERLNQLEKLRQLEELDLLESKLKPIMERFTDQSLRDEMQQILDITRAEAEYPRVTLAVDAIQPHRVADFFHLKPSRDHSHWTILESERREVPRHLLSLLADYDFAYGDSPYDERRQQTRINTILVSTLAQMKREKLEQLSPNDSTASIYLQPLQQIRLIEWPHEGYMYDVTGKMDACVWYGSPDVTETNWVVGTAKNLGEDVFYPTLAHMAMIHHARKFAGRSDTVVDGISTDGDSWHFIRIDDQSQSSSISYRWSVGTHDEIISQIHKIFAHTVALLSAIPSIERSLEDSAPIEFKGASHKELKSSDDSENISSSEDGFLMA